MKFPRATGGDKEGGWVIAPWYLRQIAESAATQTELDGFCDVSWEHIELVLLAVEQQGPDTTEGV